MAVPFDTHTFITDLIQAGMPEAQATVLSDTLQHVYRDTAVTKQDLDIRFTTLDSQLEKRFAAIDTRFAVLEGQLTHLRYLGYAIFAATVVKFFIN